MAALDVFVLFAICVMLTFTFNAAMTQVSISAPTSNVVIGGILTVRCQVWNIQPDFEVNIFRVTKTRTEIITQSSEITKSSERLNMFLAKRAYSDGSIIYFLTVVGASQNNGGEYLCKVHDLSKFVYVAEDSVHINIHSYPADVYPLCSSTPDQPTTLNVRNTLTLKCTSEKGVPTIRMKWMNNKSARYIADRNRTDGNLVHSEAILGIDNSLNGAVFSCEITSNSFPDWKRTCYIGPVTVHSDSSTEEKNGLSRNIVSENKESKQSNIQKPRLTGTCGTCSDSDDMLQFYLTIATIVTGFLSIFFLTCTIILCYKYHHASTVTRREPTRVLTPQQSIEPVYVSLQRRNVNADCEYMTLEDPNNPDNKILLPKETFDDYCRTMTLKRV